MKFNSLASKISIDKTIKAVRARGVRCELMDSRGSALEKLKSMIPGGAEVMTGSSTTLVEIGFVDLLMSGKHPWRNYKDILLSEKDPLKQADLRRKSVLAEYFLGSVHAIAETGEMVIASASGSQLPSYIFTSKNVIWVAGTQKINPDLKSAIKRVREYVLPLEDKRMKKEGYSGSTIGKLLIFEREIDPNRRVTLLLVKNRLGF